MHDSLSLVPGLRFLQFGVKTCLIQSTLQGCLCFKEKQMKENDEIERRKEKKRKENSSAGCHSLIVKKPSIYVTLF